MKTINNVRYSDLMESLNNNGYEFIDCMDGCLLDDLMCEKNKKDCYSILLLAFETYLNANCSLYTVKIARTPKDYEKLQNLWEERRQARETA